MKFMDFLAPDYRKHGQSCHNCAKLAREYDLDSDKSGVWVCEEFPENSHCATFPYEKDMSCFEPCFWFTVFAQDLRLTDSCYEAAQNKFHEVLGALGIGH